MIVTELIELLKNYEYGGVTKKPRSINIFIELENIRLFMSDPDIIVAGFGDGLITDLLLKIERNEMKND